ncbi:MAG: hypothetical protein RBU27_11970 [Bacteroidota bacterium]|jgi:hypothetical protein|nr:hypothetical protein [Bacteroidota bacterium]
MDRRVVPRPASAPTNALDGVPESFTPVWIGRKARVECTQKMNLQRMRFVRRYWQIKHSGSGWTANITFPYADGEASMITDKIQLRGVRQPVLPGAWENPIMDTSGGRG